MGTEIKFIELLSKEIWGEKDKYNLSVGILNKKMYFPVSIFDNSKNIIIQSLFEDIEIYQLNNRNTLFVIGDSFIESSWLVNTFPENARIIFKARDVINSKLINGVKIC